MGEFNENVPILKVWAKVTGTCGFQNSKVLPSL